MVVGTATPWVHGCRGELGAVIAENRRPMNEPLDSDAKARVAERGRQTLLAWRSGMNDPPEADHDRESWRQARWDELCAAIRADPVTWWEVSREVIEESDWSQLGMVGLWPFHALLAVGGEAIKAKAFEAARTDPKVAGLVVMAMEIVIGDHGRVWSGLTGTVRRLGLDTAVAANARLSEATAASTAGDDDWDSPDFWAFGLGGRLAANDPELAWAFVLALIETVSAATLDYVGAGELEDFCWEVAPAFIDRIEAEAARNHRFRVALASV
jgi:hypothetical protein